LLEKNFDYNDTSKDPTAYYEIIYGVNKAPWPVRNRDYVIKSHITYVPGTAIRPFHVNVHSENVQHALRPNQYGLVRVPMLVINLDLTPLPAAPAGAPGAPNQNTELTEVDFSVVMDPGGYIPDAVVNLISRGLPLKTLQSLAELVKTQDYNHDIERLVSYHYKKSLPTSAH
jgi:hypothetical protein